MRVMVIVKASQDSEAGVLPGQELLTAMGKYNEELVKAGAMLAGEGLHASAKGARVRFSGERRSVIDGPFAETKELITGFWLWQVKSMAEAIEWVKRCPNPHPGTEAEIEIRPVFEAEDFGPALSPELREQEEHLRTQAAAKKLSRHRRGGMSAPNLVVKWSGWGPHLQSVLRIVAAAMFGLAGTMKLFAFPVGMPPNGSTAPFLSQIWIGGALEVVGGALLLLGLFTRPVAVVLSGEMAVAYFQFHLPQGFWPIVNGGVPAVLYCFLWLYFSAAGAGAWSLDRWRVDLEDASGE